MAEHIHLDEFLTGGAMITLVILTSVAFQHWVKQRVGKETLESFHEVGGYYMSAVGTLYAVILGLVVVDATNRFNDARLHLESEANSLMEIFALSDKMPAPYRENIRETVRAYTEETLNQGWKHMALGERDIEGRVLFQQLLHEIREVEPVTENQKALYNTMLTSFVNAGESRRARLNFAQYDIPGVEWFSLIVGGIITIAFTMFFSIEHLIGQAIMTAMVTFIVSLNLYLAFLFTTPYSGDVKVPNDSFVSLQSFTQADLQRP